VVYVRMLSVRDWVLLDGPLEWIVKGCERFRGANKESNGQSSAQLIVRTWRFILASAGVRWKVRGWSYSPFRLGEVEGKVSVRPLWRVLDTEPA